MIQQWNDKGKKKSWYNILIKVDRKIKIQREWKIIIIIKVSNKKAWWREDGDGWLYEGQRSCHNLSLIWHLNPKENLTERKAHTWPPTPYHVPVHLVNIKTHMHHYKHIIPATYSHVLSFIHSSFIMLFFAIPCIHTNSNYAPNNILHMGYIRWGWGYQ